jgi:hypothetical protein
MADEITIDSSQLKALGERLEKVAAEGFNLQPIWKQIGTGMQSTIERRYKYAGANTSGKKPVEGILISSAIARKSTPQDKKKQYRKLLLASPSGSRLDTEKATPLLTTRAAMTAMKILPPETGTAGGVAVQPTKNWIVYHHPTSFTGIGRGKNLDRGYHFVDDTDVGKINKLIIKEVERQTSKMTGTATAT